MCPCIGKAWRQVESFCFELLLFKRNKTLLFNSFYRRQQQTPFLYEWRLFLQKCARLAVPEKIPHVRQAQENLISGSQSNLSMTERPSCSATVWGTSELKNRELLWLLTLRTGWQCSSSIWEWILFQFYHRNGHRSLTCYHDRTENSRHTILTFLASGQLKSFSYRSQFMFLRAEIIALDVACLGKVYTVLWA